MSKHETENQNRYKHTLNLPTTSFSIRANAHETEPAILERWEKEKLCDATYTLHEEAEKFILHDGPPYANGPIHLGSGFNKILKDVVCKYHRMFGKHVPLKPGWDCHGLPIEIKVRAATKPALELGNHERVELIKACRAYAQEWINTQRKEFKNLGVLAKWDEPYITMDPSYEAEIVRAFATFVEKNTIVRTLKTIPWCATCMTALAAAEIEHKERKDPSCYILFKFSARDASTLFGDIYSEHSDLNQIGLLVWTTTPWTIPLNRAVVLNPNARYVVIKHSASASGLIVGKELASKVCAMLGLAESAIIAEFDAKELQRFSVHHPLYDDQMSPIIFDTQVTTTDGTACMHMAPGCGPEDYLIARREGIEIYSPLTADGKYDTNIEPHELKGMSIVDGQIWVMRALAARGALIHKSSIRHSYPHCWRCRNGLMFRATKQWFCNLAQDDLVGKTLQEIQDLMFVPSNGKMRLQATIGSRSEWCISRQRIWGVPIIALLCGACDSPYINPAFIRAIAEGIARDGIEYWHEITVQDLIKQKVLPASFCCATCGNQELELVHKEYDILDVWFDSGISHTAVLKSFPELRYPADIYLEGSDQHRGWFQSSLLSAMVMHGSSCTKGFVTHGYVVDAHGQKMSKSLGNVIAPNEVIATYSRDILRLWVASVDFSSDMVISDALLKNVAEVYRKIRNTARFLLSNLYDFKSEADTVPLEEMLAIDQYALARLHEVSQKVHDAYVRYDISAVYQLLGTYCSNDLSAFFLDIMKDRLYTAKVNSRERRSAQTACWQILATLSELMAPVLSFLAQEIADHQTPGRSIHLATFTPSLDVWETLQTRALTESTMHVPGAHATPDKACYAIAKTSQWGALEIMRDVVLKMLEEIRVHGIIRHSLEAKVEVYIDRDHNMAKLIFDMFDDIKNLQTPQQFLSELWIVSQVTLVTSPKGLMPTALPWLNIRALHASGEKCPRCWQWDEDPGVDNLCRRCQRQLA